MTIDMDFLTLYPTHREPDEEYADGQHPPWCVCGACRLEATMQRVQEEQAAPAQQAPGARYPDIIEYNKREIERFIAAFGRK
jgi:hypothetical protein